MLKAIKNNNFTKASEEMLNSQWAKEVKTRAKVLARLMKKGAI